MRILTLVLLTGLTACGSKAKTKTAFSGQRPAASSGASAEVGPASSAGGGSDIRTTDGDDLSWLGPVYFAFDSSELNEPTRTTLQRLHDYLREHPRAALTIEGHTDEQGTTEYNIGLGQRRAQAIADYLTRLGTDPRRLTTITFGAERPAADGHDEIAWSRNRRGELRSTSR